jgi:hypothetical protein
MTFKNFGLTLTALLHGENEVVLQWDDALVAKATTAQIAAFDLAADEFARNHNLTRCGASLSFLLVTEGRGNIWFKRNPSPLPIW